MTQKLWFLFIVLAGLLLGSCLPREEKSRRQPADAEQVEPSKARKPRERREEPTDDKEQQVAKARTDPLIQSPFADDFERPSLGKDWRETGPGWRIRDGRLCGKKAKNHPLWLARRLPVNALIEFTATSHSSDGDIKVELWGDGASSATSVSYKDATSYVLIFGGWRNRYHVLARLDEHGKDRLVIDVDKASKQLPAQAVEKDRAYRFKIERGDAQTLSWWVNDTLVHQLEDPTPLKGPGHDHLGFNDWEAEVCFDNLKVTPL